MLQREISDSVDTVDAVDAADVVDIVVMGDRAGVVEWANTAWRDLLGLPLDESAGKPIGSLLDRFEVDPSVVAFVSERFLAGEACEVEFPFSASASASNSDLASNSNSPSGGEQRWLHVRVNPRRDRDGDVTRFVATGHEITQRASRDMFEVDECELSPLVGECAASLASELGSRTSFDEALAEDLPPTYANPAEMAALVRHLIRRGARVIGDEWGTVSLTTGLVGLGEEPIGSRYLAAGMPIGPYLYLEVHDTGLTTLAEAQARLQGPFLSARQPAGGVRFPNAVQWVEQLGGRIELEHDGPFGTAITIVVPA